MLLKRYFNLTDIKRSHLNEINNHLLPYYELNYHNYDDLQLKVKGKHWLDLETRKNKKWADFIDGKIPNFIISLDNHLLKEEEQVRNFTFYVDILHQFINQIEYYCDKHLKLMWDVTVAADSIICSKGHERIIICDAGCNDAIKGKIDFNLFIPKKCIREEKKIQHISVNNTLKVQISVEEIESKKYQDLLKDGFYFNDSQLDSISIWDKNHNNIELKFTNLNSNVFEVEVPVICLKNEVVLRLTT